jgi:hypothetical protein
VRTQLLGLAVTLIINGAFGSKGALPSTAKAAKIRLRTLNTAGAKKREQGRLTLFLLYSRTNFVFSETSGVNLAPINISHEGARAGVLFF